MSNQNSLIGKLTSRLKKAQEEADLNRAVLAEATEYLANLPCHKFPTPSEIKTIWNEPLPLGIVLNLVFNVGKKELTRAGTSISAFGIQVASSYRDFHPDNCDPIKTKSGKCLYSIESYSIVLHNLHLMNIGKYRRM